MFRIKVNGTVYSYQEGKTILDLLKSIRIELPTLCNDDRLRPSFSCRMCMVKVNGSSRMFPACNTKLSENMEIETHLPEIEDYRKSMLRMLANHYPLSAVDKYPDKEFHRWLRHYGIVQEMDKDIDVSATVDASHPYIHVDMSRCISCFRCVNICNDLQGQFVWHMVDKGDKSKIIPDSKGLLADSSCVGCGACADTCPTGAIEDKHVLQYGMAEKKIDSVCAYCGVGCEIEVGVKNNIITGIHPKLNAPVSKGHLCVKGRYAWEYGNSKDRIQHPMIRIDDEWKIVSWTEAIRYCSQKLKSTAWLYGADSIAVLGSARATNEENYLIQKFTRTVLGTNNIDCCARVCHQPTAKAMSMILGTGAATNSFDDIEKAKTILVVGSNTTENHPVVGARIKRMALHGANLIVIDPRKIELAGFASCHLALKPGTNVPLFNAMAQVIVEEGLFNPEFIEKRIEGWEEYKKSVNKWTPERVAEVCEVPSQLIRQAARLYAVETPSICFHGLGITEHVQGTEGVMALVNLALLTGNIGEPGTGINPLRGQNNVQGSAAMGCDPSVFTGLASVKKERNKFEELWKVSLPESKGLNLSEMLEAASAGNLKTMWIVGYDVFFTMPDAYQTEHAFEKLDFLIVQDMFMNETAKKFADVFLPVASSFEKEGTFMNSERRIQKIQRAIPPPPDVKSDWEIICMMADEMGKKHLFDFSKPEEIWNEIRRAWKAVYGITYERLEVAGIQWPCEEVNHPGTEILHTEKFPIGDKVKLSSIDFTPSPEETSDEYPFLLITGRELCHFNAGTMTYRTPNKNISYSDFLHIHPDDAERIGLKEGCQAKMISRYGKITLPTCIDLSMKKGEVFTTFHNKNIFANKITSHFKDNYVQTPEYKITAVRIEKVAGL